MKKMRKGFTLVELLIVISILGALSAMMASSSTESIDKAQANAIINNLQTMKTAAYSMYVEKPEVASLMAISGNSQSVTLTGATSATTVEKVLGEFLGRVDIAQHYGIFGDEKHWYVYYEIQPSDSAKVKAILGEKANAAGLLAADDTSVDGIDDYSSTYYSGNEEYLVLMVR